MLLLRTVQDLTRNYDPAMATPSPCAKSHRDQLALCTNPYYSLSEDHLGVEFATSFEAPLCSIGSGPDILGKLLMKIWCG